MNSPISVWKPNYSFTIRDKANFWKDVGYSEGISIQGMKYTGWYINFLSYTLLHFSILHKTRHILYILYFVRMTYNIYQFLLYTSFYHLIYNSFLVDGDLLKRFSIILWEMFIEGIKKNGIQNEPDKIDKNNFLNRNP